MLSKPEWPNWSGRPVLIVAGGPSVSAVKADLPALEGRVTGFAIKRAVELMPWAAAVYGCDGPWWRSRRGLREFRGLKMAYAHDLAFEYPEIRIVRVETTANRLLLEPIGTIGSGGNSGFQALNLAAQFGARRILLLGFDSHDRSGAHWYGRNNWPGANNPDETLFRRWRAAFGVAARELEGLGVEVINVSVFSEVPGFRKSTLADALKGWGI